MFTGIILGQGEIRSVQNMGKETRLTIKPLCELTDYVLGESIATNGVCLTVEEFGADWFTVYASAETMGLTNLGKLKTGSRINLERALAMGDPPWWPYCEWTRRLYRHCRFSASGRTF